MAVRIRGVIVCHSEDGGQGMCVKWLISAPVARWRMSPAAR